MTRKTTTKKPSQLDRAIKRIDKLVFDLEDRLKGHITDLHNKVITETNAIDETVDRIEGKADLLLKGSDFMKEIGEKEEPWVPKEGELAVVNCDDYPTLCPRGTIGILRKPEGYARDLFAMYFNGDKWNFRIREVREPLPAEVQKYEEQVKAQEWAKVDELQVGDQCVTSKAEALSILGRCAGAGIPHGDVEILTTCCPVFLWQGDRLGANMSHDHKSGPMYPVGEWERRLEGTIAKRKAQEQEAKKAHARKEVIEQLVAIKAKLVDAREYEGAKLVRDAERYLLG